MADERKKQDPLDSDQILAIGDHVRKKLATYAKVFGIANAVVLLIAAWTFYDRLEKWQDEAIDDVKEQAATAATTHAEDQLEILFGKYSDQIGSLEDDLKAVDERSDEAKDRASELIGRIQTNEEYLTRAQDRYSNLVESLSVLSDEEKVRSARIFVEDFSSNSALQQMLANSETNKTSLAALEPLLSNRTFVGKQTGVAFAPTKSWVNIPGAEVKLNLKRKGTANLHGLGSVNGKDTPASLPSNAARAHCGFRFVVDDKPIGNSPRGDQTVGCGIRKDNKTERTKNHSGWWCSWGIRRLVELEKGPHTIKLQLAGWHKAAIDGAGCQIIADDRSAVRLFVDMQYAEKP